MENTMEDRSLVEANFDLEQGILRCWNLTSDLSELTDDVDSGAITAEEALSVIKSYVRVYDNRFDRTWRLYETVCRGLHDLRHQQQLVTEPPFDAFLDGVVEKPQKKVKKNSKKG